jgi:hypothetical protein
MAELKRKRARTYETQDVVIAFARYGTSIDTMARALTTLPSTVEGICRRGVETGELSVMPPKSPADIRSAVQTEVIHLREEVTRLNAHVRELRGVEPGSAEDFVTVAGLTPSEAMIVSQLVKHGKATKQRLYHALYGDRPNPDDTPEPKIIDVLIHKIRQKIKPHGLAIETVWAWGYAMTQEHIAGMMRMARDKHQGTRPAPSLAPDMADMVPIG